MSDAFVLGVGFVIDLEELDAALDYISHDEHRWEAVSDDTGQWGDDRCVIIRYSNPSGADIPNEISFRFRCLPYYYPFSRSGSYVFIQVWQGQFAVVSTSTAKSLRARNVRGGAVRAAPGHAVNLEYMSSLGRVK